MESLQRSVETAANEAGTTNENPILCPNSMAIVANDLMELEMADLDGLEEL